jgi:hypothetical protein
MESVDVGPSMKIGNHILILISACLVCLVCGCGARRPTELEPEEHRRQMLQAKADVEQDEGEMKRLHAELRLMQVHLGGTHYGNELSSNAEEAAEAAYPKSQILADTLTLKDISRRRLRALQERHRIYKEAYTPEGVTRSKQLEAREGQQPDREATSQPAPSASREASHP